MNMILRDVEEVYTPRYTEDSAEETNIEKELQRRQRAINDGGTTLDGSWAVRRRYMKQLLVRGDIVVMVYKAESERSAWPQTSKSPAKSAYRRVDTTTLESRLRVGTPGSLIYAQPKEKRGRLH
jgi:small nuclear ribonucleoprotein (snRNP)-like protein